VVSSWACIETTTVSSAEDTRRTRPTHQAESEYYSSYSSSSSSSDTEDNRSNHSRYSDHGPEEAIELENTPPLQQQLSPSAIPTPTPAMNLNLSATSDDPASISPPGQSTDTEQPDQTSLISTASPVHSSPASVSLPKKIHIVGFCERNYRVAEIQETLNEWNSKNSEQYTLTGWV
jgi:hypothetical protein